MTIALGDVPAERGELRGDLAEAHHLRASTVDLQTVVVNDRNEVLESVMSGEHRGLPHLTLL